MRPTQNRIITPSAALRVVDRLAQQRARLAIEQFLGN